MDCFQKTLKKRKQKELNPMLEMIKEISSVQATDPKSTEFNKFVKDLEIISSAADKSLDKLLKSESNFFLNAFVKVMR